MFVVFSFESNSDLSCSHVGYILRCTNSSFWNQRYFKDMVCHNVSCCCVLRVLLQLLVSTGGICSTTATKDMYFYLFLLFLTRCVVVVLLFSVSLTHRVSSKISRISICRPAFFSLIVVQQRYFKDTPHITRDQKLLFLNVTS